MGTTLMNSPAQLPQVLNQVQWGGPAHRGHYEVWYLTIHDPVTRRAFWLRHTLHAPTDGRPAHAALWAFSFEPGGKGVQAIDRFAIESFQERTPGGIELGPARYGPRVARGEVGEGANRVAWDLVLDPGPFGTFMHVPSKLYRVRLAGSLVSTPALSFGVSGWIEAGGVRTRLDGAVGEQGHVFGRRHADRWAWAHVHRFEDDDGVLEAMSAQVRKLGVLIPPASALCLHTSAGRLAWNRTRELWTTRSRFELGRWELDARSGDHRVTVKVSAPHDAFISVEYEDPSGERVYCNHTEHGDAEVEVHRREGGEWRVQRRHVAKGTTAFEIGERGTRDARPVRRLDQAETRAVSSRA